MSRIVQGIWWCLQNLGGINTHSYRSPPSVWWPLSRDSALPQKVRRGAKFKILNFKTTISTISSHLHFIWTNFMCFLKILVCDRKGWRPKNPAENWPKYGRKAYGKIGLFWCYGRKRIFGQKSASFGRKLSVSAENSLTAVNFLTAVFLVTAVFR